MRFDREGEWAYHTNSNPTANTDANADNGDRWASEYGFLQGVGEDAGETVLMVSSGAPAAAPAATTPSQAATSAGSSNILDSITRSLTSLVPVAANVYAQKKLIELNQQRSMMGQPLLTAAEFQALQPTANVVVGPNETAKKVMIYGGLALLGVLGLRAAKII